MYTQLGAHQAPKDSSKPIATQKVLIKISGSQNKTKRHGCGKGACWKEVGVIGVGETWERVVSE